MGTKSSLVVVGQVHSSVIDAAAVIDAAGRSARDEATARLAEHAGVTRAEVHKALAGEFAGRDSAEFEAVLAPEQARDALIAAIMEITDEDLRGFHAGHVLLVV